MMRDVMQSSGLALFAEVGLVLFFAAFVAIVAYVLRKKKEYYDQLALLPLRDDECESQGQGPDATRRSRP